jgi:type VI secretion system protein ImpJ
MSFNRRVVWSEGLFLRPHHLQQQERHVEQALHLRVGALRGDGWGFVELEYEQDLLMIGKFGIRRARGVFPDGTPFSMPDDDPLPKPIDVTEAMRGQIVHLAIPVRRSDAAETERAPPPDSMARFETSEVTVRDGVAGFDGDASVEVGALRARFVLASQPTEGYACIPLAQIFERRSDGRVTLEERFIPSTMACRAAERIQKFLVELHGLLKQRGDTLAQRAVASGRSGSAEIVDFLMLQTVNRYEPVFAHLAAAGVVHPADAYLRMIELGGDLATLTLDSRRPPALVPYRHDQQQATFEPVMDLLRAEFGVIREERAVPIPLVFKNVAYVGTVLDRALFDAAMFVLVLRADVPSDHLRRQAPAQIKISEKDFLPKIVGSAVAGIPLQPLATAPRQIPFVTNAAYFELLQGGELWNALRRTGQIGIFVYDRDRAFPNLSIELWAVRT